MSPWHQGCLQRWEIGGAGSRQALVLNIMIVLNQLLSLLWSSEATEACITATDACIIIEGMATH
jgi:hypothetical protein